MTIVDIQLGDFSAENDVNLSEYFLKETQAYQSAISFDDNRYILLGRTGSGKSAILSYIYNTLKNDRRYICALIKPGKSYLDAIVQTDAFYELKKAPGLQHILYKLIWHYVIMVAVLREKYGSTGPIRKGSLLVGKDLRAYQFLKKVQQLSREDKTLFDIISGLIEEISVTLEGMVTVSGKVENPSSFKVMKNLIKETESFHEQGFWDVVGGAKLYLLFDDLDLGWNPDNEDQQLLLRGLFEIMRNYAYRPRVKPLIALRTNILSGLRLPQREKFENNILPIRWTKPSLREMLLLRLRKYGDFGEECSFSKIFHITNTEKPINYMIGRTLYRPRDLLAFSKYAISDAARLGAEKVSLSHVQSAESIYAVNRLEALTDEWKYLYPNIDSLVKLLIKVASKGYNLYELTPGNIRTILVEVKERILTAPKNENQYTSLMWLTSYFPDDESPYDIVRILYKLGIIGYSQNRSSFIFVHESEELPSPDSETKFSFHPMLYSIPTGDFSFEEENPWL